MVALKIASDFDPTDIISGSDGVDFYAVSKFDKDPAVLKGGGLQKEIDIWKRMQREWVSAAPNAKRHYIPGNHENRLETYLWRHPEMYDLEVLKLKNLLGLSDVGIGDPVEEVSFGEEKKLVIKHGEVVRKGSAMSAKGELEKEFHSVSIMTGHTHRGGSYFATGRNGVVFAHECFCLCSLNPNYMKNPNWQQGFSIATVTKDTISIESIPIFTARGKKIARWRGKEYTSGGIDNG